MNFGTEHILLIMTTLAGVLKAYFEMKKAKAEAARADAESQRATEAEGLLTAAVEGIEEVRKENPLEGKKIAQKIHKKTVMRGVAAAFDEVVQEVTKGQGQLDKVTRRLSKTRVIKTLDGPPDAVEKH